jgi:hypothetical protein
LNMQHMMVKIAAEYQAIVGGAHRFRILHNCATKMFSLSSPLPPPPVARNANNSGHDAELSKRDPKSISLRPSGPSCFLALGALDAKRFHRRRKRCSGTKKSRRDFASFGLGAAALPGRLSPCTQELRCFHRSSSPIGRI